MTASWDMFFKAAGLLSALIVIPTFGWVWSTNEEVSKISIKVEQMEKDIEKMSKNELNVELLKKDIQYIKTDIAEIKDLLKKRTP